MAEKIIVEEFDICHKLVNDFENLYFNNSYGFSHNVSCDRFMIWIHHDSNSAKIIDNQINAIKKLSVKYELVKNWLWNKQSDSCKVWGTFIR